MKTNSIMCTIMSGLASGLTYVEACKAAGLPAEHLAAAVGVGAIAGLVGVAVKSASADKVREDLADRNDWSR